MIEQSPSIEISFRDLAVIKGGRDARLPLSALDGDSHIHGELRIKIQGRLVPHLGFWGANDACFSQWIDELGNVLKSFEGEEEASYTFDEGEQGQPAFLFEKHGDVMHLSIVDSMIADGAADPDWQKIAFSYADFVEQYAKFKNNFLMELQAAVPGAKDIWIANFMRGAG